MRSSWWQALLVVSGLVGCSSSAFFRSSGSKQERLDVLTSFSQALSTRDYRRAADYLAPDDRAKLASAEAGILPEYRERVDALRPATLLNNPLIEVRHGLISGIPDVLPILVQGLPDSLGSQPITPVSRVAAAPDSGPEMKAEEKELKRTAEAFFRAVSRKEWATAVSYLDAGERQDFLDPKGGLKPEDKRRLAAVDTSQWRALTLKDGKLTGVFLIIPDSPARSPTL